MRCDRCRKKFEAQDSFAVSLHALDARKCETSVNGGLTTEPTILDLCGGCKEEAVRHWSKFVDSAMEGVTPSWSMVSFDVYTTQEGEWVSAKVNGVPGTHQSRTRLGAIAHALHATAKRLGDLHIAFRRDER